MRRLFRRRFLVALIASAWAHAWLVHVATGSHAGRLTDATIALPEIAVTFEAQPPVPQSTDAAEEPMIPVWPAAPAPRAARSRTPVTAETRPQGVPDSRYYGARELDVYPRLAAPLEFPRGRPQEVAGRVELLLLVSAAGEVEDATVLTVEGPPILEPDARRVLSAARFIPGERDGRRVKARLVVEVSFGER